MGNRSRLRTQKVKRRRLFLLAPILLAIIGGALWYGTTQRFPLFDQVRSLFRLEGWQRQESSALVRGTIYDRNYKEMAVSYERVSVYANIRELKNLEQVVDPLVEILGASKADLTDLLGGNSLRIWLARDISQKQEEQIRKLELPGIFLHKEYVRYYPAHESAAHLIGFVEKDSGLSGIEYFLNQLQIKYRINRAGLDKLPLVGDGRPGVDGRHLILTLDMKIQQILERYLQAFSGRSPGFKVGALVMEAGSGALIGYSQIPSFDPNSFHTYPEQVFSDIFQETMAVPESFKVFLRDMSLLESQSNTISEPLPWSVAAESRKLGVQLQLWEKLGAGSLMEYDFSSTPTLMSDRVAYDDSEMGERDFETVPVLQAPLQVLTALTRSLNGGVRIMPHAADRYVLRRNQSEYLLDDLEKPVEGGLLNKGVSAEARKLFTAQAQSGPLGSAILEGGSVSYSRNEGMKSFKRHELLVAAVPSEEPELILMIVGTQPGYETELKTPVARIADARKIIVPIAALQEVMKNLADMMKPQEREETNFSSPAGEAATNGTTATAEDTSAPELVMPRLEGMSLRKSLRLLQAVDVVVEVRGTGRVVEQQPAAGGTLVVGTKVVLVLERDSVDAGYKADQAAETIQDER